MKYSLCIASALVFIPALSWAQGTDDSHTVQAGTRIGRIFIGDTSGAVGRRLGKPTRTFTLGKGLTSQLWRGKVVGDLGTRNTLEVVFRNGFVTQIEATSLIFETPGGLSLASSRSKWENTYGIPTSASYSYRGGTRKRYLDWKAKGLALELVKGSRAGDEWTYQTLIVHKKGTSVLPDLGGVRN